MQSLAITGTFHLVEPVAYYWTADPREAAYVDNFLFKAEGWTVTSPSVKNWIAQNATGQGKVLYKSIGEYKAAYEAYVNQMLAQNAVYRAAAVYKSAFDPIVSYEAAKLFTPLAFFDGYFNDVDSALTPALLRLFTATNLYKGPGKYEIFCTNRRVVTIVVQRPPVSGLALNGVDTFIQVDATLPLTTQATVEMWARGIPKQAHLFYVADSNNNRQLSSHLPFIDGNVYFDAGADASNNFDRLWKGMVPMDDASTWNHWAFVRNSASGRTAIYKNGAVWAEVTSGLVRPMTGCKRLVIGAYADGSLGFSGAITEFRLWNVERTTAQINETMNRRIPGADTGLIASYALEGGYQAGQSIVDRSGSGNNGIAHGAPANVDGPNGLLK